jgi:hypothetical protein
MAVLAAAQQAQVLQLVTPPGKALQDRVITAVPAREAIMLPLVVAVEHLRQDLIVVMWVRLAAAFMLVALVALDWQQQFQHRQASAKPLVDLFIFQAVVAAVVTRA